MVCDEYVLKLTAAYALVVISRNDQNQLFLHVLLVLEAVIEV